MTIDDRTERYAHDCAACVSVGQSGRYDLYYCGGSDPTVIARYGPAGEYMSGMCFALSGAEPYATALRNAIAAGHCDDKGRDLKIDRTSTR